MSYTTAKATFNDAGAALWGALATQFPAVITALDAVWDDYAGPNPSEMLTSLAAIRSTLAAEIGSGPPGAMSAFGRLYDQYARSIVEMAREVGYAGSGTDSGTVTGAIGFLQQYMGDVGIFPSGSVDERIADRPMTRGTITPPTGVKVWRLLVDEWGQPIRRGQFETNRYIVRNANGSRPRALTLLNQGAGVDVFDQRGSGNPLGTTFAMLDEITGSVINNSRLNLNGTPVDSAPVTTVEGWTLGSNWVTDTTSPFRSNVSSLRTNADTTIRQDYANLNPDASYMPIIAVYPDTNFVTNNCKAIIKWGSKTHDVVGSSMLTANQWNVVGPTMDEELWVGQLDSASVPRIELEIDIVTAGVVKVGLIGFVRGTPVNGINHFAAIQNTSPVVDAVGTVTDAADSGEVGRHCYMQQLGWGIHMPVNGTTDIDTITPSA